MPIVEQEKKYRFRISFTAEVQGKNEADALFNASWGLKDRYPFSNIHNTKIEAKGFVSLVTPADDTAKEELPKVAEVPEAPGLPPASDQSPF